MTRLVLSVIADDRPGLIKAISNVVVDHGGNWLESRFALLSGKFAGIVNVEVAPRHADGLIKALSALQASGLELIIGQSRDVESKSAGTEMELEVVGADHPGIVHEITELLAARDINVEEMSSDRKAASMSGTPIFEAWLRVRVPEGRDRATLRSEVEKLARDLVVDVTFSEQSVEKRN